MSRYNTGNPLGSNKAKDLDDNAKNLDLLTNDLVNDTFDDRFGVARDTVKGRLKKLGYQVPVVYEAGIVFNEGDATKTVSEGYFIYAPLPAQLPLTTTGVWETDKVNFFAIQGVTGDESTLKESVTVDSAQTEVTFSVISPGNATFYVSGFGVDNGRLIQGVDYTVSTTISKTIELTNSYPDNTIILGIQGEISEDTQVTSVFGRSGAVLASDGDYNSNQITYDNDDSTLVGDTVKEAIDELDSKATLNYSNINTLKADNPNNKTADYTLSITDENKTIWMNSASANTLTIPTDISVNFAINTIVMVMMEGVGVTSVTATSGVTLNGVDGGSGDLEQYSGCTLVKRGANTWIATPLEVS